MYYDAANTMQRCRACGHKIAFEAETLDEAIARRAAEQEAAPAPPYAHILTTRVAIDPRARSLYETAHSFLRHQDRDEALLHFRRAVEVQPEFVDASLWLARLSEDEATRRAHLDTVLAYDPGNLEALRLLMVLNGQMSEADVARTYQDQEPQVRTVVMADMPAQTLACPVCGGALTVEADPDHPGRQRSVCVFCGHSQPLTAQTSSESLGMALLRQKADPVRWELGAWQVRCGQCGAERTLPPDRMTHECPFCGSSQILRVEEGGYFQQPDGVLPFLVNEAEARAALDTRLKGVDQRISQFFDAHRVTDVRIEACFLPFWAFDALLDTTITHIDKTPRWEDRRGLQANPSQQRHYREQSGATDVLVPAFTSPSPALADDASPVDLTGQVGYDQQVLARVPALLYSIPVDKASLMARSRASARIRDEQHASNSDNRVEVRVNALVTSMSFSLVLLPFWIVTLLEGEGRWRAALVGGRNGRVALGKRQRA